MAPIRLDHIAIALPHIADAAAALVDVLGGIPESIQPSRGFRWATWTYAGGGRIEILEPVGPDGFLRRFLAAHGPGIHHVTFKVPDLGAMCDRAGARGYQVVGRNEADPSWKEAFLHPNDALGIVVQVVEVGAASPADAPRPLPAGPPDAPRPVRIVGLRMRARSPERALVQWRDLLEGRVDETPEGGLTFHWPRSPMRIAVELDPTGAEGPIGIDLVGAPPAVALEAAGARLGTRLHAIPRRLADGIPSE
jgi:methylmalonyl-CoA/ethylmalonyl-CoA epimerase